MSQAYERFAKRRSQGPKKGVAPKFNLHKVSFDDSVDSSRSDIPNIFHAQRSQAQIPNVIMREKKREPQINKQESRQELKVKKEEIVPIISLKKREEVSSLNRSQQQVEYQEQEEIPQPQAEIEPHTSLSLFEIIKLYLGEYLFHNPYPIKKAIYINNNNDQENEINKKQFQIKFKNDQKEISHFNNSLAVSSTLFAAILTIRNVFTYFYIYAWIGIIILQSIAESTILNSSIQYGSQKGGLIALLVIAVIIQLVADWLSVRKRRGWDENRSSYKVYHHNGRMAEWANIKAHQIKPGHLYKIPPGEYAPTDCVLIHCEHSIVHIKENHIVSCLVQASSEIVIKQTLLKGESVNLPLSGSLAYEITNPEYSDFQIVGKLSLEEPHEVNHPIGMSQIILRGSINYSDAEILCLAMETGIDSLFIKNLQYPFQHRKAYQQSAHIKAKIISDQISHDIKQRHGTIIGVPIEKRLQSAVIIFILMFLFLSAIGVLTNFIYRITTKNEYYLTQTTISIINIAIYHLTNFIIFIPVLLIPIFKLFVALSGSVTQSNISKRPIDLIPQNDKQRRTGSFSVSHNQLLDNKKIIFPVKIKDHNILHQLSSVDTIVTTIDSFRDQSAFTLHSIKVKGISHNFSTTSLDNEIYSTEAVEDIRTFMSFAIFTTSKNQYDLSYHYDDGIEFTAKKYLDLKKIKNAYGEMLINNNDQFKVKPIFIIKATSEYPYKVVFLEPVGGDIDQNPEVLVLIRGDTKTILDKTYGKEIQLTVQSRKLHEEKDFYVQLMAKTSVKYSDALEIQRAYSSNSIEKTFFYKNLDKFISRVQPMGLLIFNNNFFQKKIGQTIRNPLLNKSILSQYRYQKSQMYDADVLTSQHLPNLIILSPPSKSSQPQFESIHTIKSLLTNSNLFNFTLSQVGDKILHQKPSNLQKMMDQLQSERVIVWNGWDQKDITYTIDVLRKYGQKILLYVQKDQYMYLMKECDCAVKGSKLGYDANKYSDIDLSSRSSISFFYLTQLIRYDAIIVKQGLISLFLTQISKFTFYLVIEFINLFYTRGTGLTVIRTPLYLVVEVVLLIDIFYYLNWKDSMRAQTFNKKEHFSVQLFVRISHSILQAVITTFICFYSLQSPVDSTGTPNSYHFPYFIIVFVFLHILIFQKLFNVLTYSFSVYKGILIAAQILALYIGFIIVTLVDTYGYYGILWNALKGKSFLTAVCCIWIGLTLPAIRMLLQLAKGRKLKRGDKARKTF